MRCMAENKEKAEKIKKTAKTVTSVKVSGVKLRAQA
jgi:hypothetical protein